MRKKLFFLYFYIPYFYSNPSFGIHTQALVTRDIVEFRIFLWYLAWLLSGKRYFQLLQQALSVALAFFSQGGGVAAGEYKEKSYECPKKRCDKLGNAGSIGNFVIDIEVANLVRCYNKLCRLVLVGIFLAG